MNTLKFLKRMLAVVLLALLLPKAAAAYDFMVGGLCYSKNSNGTSVSVVQNTSTPSYTGAISIPASVTYSGTTYSVTAIGMSAFYGCSGVTSVSIPNSVTYIRDNAFYGCSGVTSVTIPNSVTSIGLGAFQYCSGLTSVTIPNSVTSIGNAAFSFCSGLTSIVVASGNPKYDSRGNCNAIIETATNALVSGCNNTDIPNSITSIRPVAFAFCSGLTSVTIPNSVTSISNNAFVGCSCLTSIVVASGNPKYDSRDNCNAIIETATNTLVSGCKNTVFPNSVTSIGVYAFYGCSGLTSVTIPNSVTSIGGNAFNGCSGLTSVTIPNSVTSIGSRAFQECSGLIDLYSYIENPSDVTLADHVFYSVPTSTCMLHVPYGSGALYGAADQWKDFTNIVEMELPTVLATSVTLNETAAEMTAGETLQLTATVFPENATDRTVTWTSSNTAVATVDANGLVTAVAPGTTTITATTDDGTNLTATCAMTVKTQTVVGDDRLYINDFSIEAGETKLVEIQLDNMVAYTALQADIYLPEGLSIEQEDGEYLFDLTDRKACNHTISSSDLASGAIRILIASQTLKTFSGNSGALVTFNIIADVSFSGQKVIELKNVVATEPDQTEHQLPNTTCTVSGNSNPSVVLASSISLNQATAEVAEGETLQLTATVLPDDATDRTVSWTSSNTAVATVNANGLVTAVAAGTATITATTNDGTNLTAICTVTVPQPVVVPEALELNEKAFRLQLNQTHQVTVVTEGIEGVTWSSSDATIASVDANGVVTALKNGIAIITATAANGAVAWCAVYSYMRGDVDEDNTVDVSDVNVVVNIILHKE